MTNTVIFEIPVGGAGCDGISISSDGVDVRVEIQAHEGGGTLRFLGVCAFRFANELHSRGFILESYDSIVNVHDSSWRQGMIEGEPEDIFGSARTCRHLAVFFSNCGYLEVLSRNVQFGNRLFFEET